MSQAYDVIIVGAGVVGLSSAVMLRQAGIKRILVVDKGAPGREASWAGGGILSPIHPHKYPGPLAALCARSATLYPKFIKDIEELAAFSTEFRSTGLIRLGQNSDDLAEIQAFHSKHGTPFRVLDKAEAKEIEPALSPDFSTVLYEADINQVRNPRLLKALITACSRLGVELLSDDPVERLLVSGDTVEGVQTTRAAYHGEETVLSAGAWSGRIMERSLRRSLKVVPIHGEMLRVETFPPLIKAILIHDGHYLIPRADGQVIIGSTLHDWGFDKKVCLESVQGLLAAAIRIVPALAHCEWKQAWAGLRPASPDRLPYIGRPVGIAGLTVATGHYRNGLLLGPATAEAVTSTILGTDPTLDLSPYAVDRKVPEFRL
ncbi:MAG: glycine oxidase ThiO [Planctomycetota bacterium]|nr:glycine oxidase ThiO [Planctomycetota bacterium]